MRNTQILTEGTSLGHSTDWSLIQKDCCFLCLSGMERGLGVLILMPCPPPRLHCP